MFRSLTVIKSTKEWRIHLTITDISVEKDASSHHGFLLADEDHMLKA